MKDVPGDLSNFKSIIDKLVSVPVDLCKLSYVVKNDAIKKMYIMLKLKY